MIAAVTVSLLLLACNALPSQKADLSEIISLPDDSSGKALIEWTSTQVGNPEEQGNYFEGDIILSLDQRNGIRQPAKRWANGVVPFKIGSDFTSKQKLVISNAMEQIQKNTCIEFRLRTKEKDFIYIDNDESGCWSSVGKMGGAQKVNLQDACLKKIGTVIHELLHAIGFYHEQSRSDRDDYVKILTENIPRHRFLNFIKLNSGFDETFGVSYDYASVLHYSPKAFSMNGSPTIEATVKQDSSSELMGQRDRLSKKDIEKVNKMYCE